MIDVNKLFPYQLDDARWLSTKTRGALFHEPGVGKTYISMGAAKLAGVSKVAVFCPKSMVGTWESALQQWGFSGYVANYDKLISAKFVPSIVDLVIADECHALKDWKAKRTKRFYTEIVKTAGKTWFLSGTPAPRSNADLFLLLSYLQPKTHGKYKEFLENYCYNKSFRVNGRMIESWYGYKNTEKINEFLKQVGLRRSKEEVYKDMPDLMVSDIRVASKPALISQCLDIPENVIREAIHERQQIPAHLASIVRAIGVSKVPDCVDFVTNLNVPCLIFAIHKEVIDGLMEGLKDFKVSKIDGSVSTPERTQRIAQFQAGHLDIMILQTHAAGTGITLTRASHVVHCERPWSAAAYEQANARAHRYGQKNAVNVYNIVASKTIDELISSILAEKAQGMGEIIAA